MKPRYTVNGSQIPRSPAMRFVTLARPIQAYLSEEAAVAALNRTPPTPALVTHRLCRPRTSASPRRAGIVEASGDTTQRGDERHGHRLRGGGTRRELTLVEPIAAG
jgi:hypothetical protein